MATETNKLTGRGGPGRGQGRKKLNPMKKKKVVSVRLPPGLIRRMDNDGGDYTALIIEALEEYFDNKAMHSSY